jgi:hypothetical protein
MKRQRVATRLKYTPATKTLCANCKINEVHGTTPHCKSCGHIVARGKVIAQQHGDADRMAQDPPQGRVAAVPGVPVLVAKAGPEARAAAAAKASKAGR